MPATRRSGFPFLLIKPFRDSFSFTGRSTRSELFAFSVAAMIADGVRTSLFDTPLGSPSTLEICWEVFWTFPLLALTVRRLHDRGFSAKWLLVHAAAVLVWLTAALLPQGPAGSNFTLMLWSAHPASGPASAALLLAYIVLMIWMAVLWLMPGDAGPNRYGDDPRDISRHEPIGDKGSHAAPGPTATH